MEVRVLTPEKTVFSGQAKRVEVIADRGQLTILENHANLVSLVKEGPLKVETVDAGLKAFEISDGVFKCENNTLSILCPRVFET